MKVSTTGSYIFIPHSPFPSCHSGFYGLPLHVTFSSMHSCSHRVASFATMRNMHYDSETNRIKYWILISNFSIQLSLWANKKYWFLPHYIDSIFYFCERGNAVLTHLISSNAQIVHWNHSFRIQFIGKWNEPKVHWPSCTPSWRHEVSKNGREEAVWLARLLHGL